MEEIVIKRGQITSNFQTLFRPYEEKGCLRTPKPPEGVKLNHHAFFVIFDNEEHQHAFLTLLREKSIHAYIGYTPLHSSAQGRKYGYRPEDLPLTNDIARRIVRLPFYTDLVENGLGYCIDGMHEVLKTLYGF